MIELCRTLLNVLACYDYLQGVSEVELLRNSVADTLDREFGEEMKI